MADPRALVRTGEPSAWRVGRVALMTFVMFGAIALSMPAAAQQQQQQLREREAVRRAQAATQKAEQENAQLQDQNKKLEKEKQDLSTKLKASEKVKGQQLAASKKKEAEQAQQIERLQQEAAAAKTKIADLEAKLQSLNAQVAEGQEQNRQLTGQVKTLEGRLDQQREIIARQSQAMQQLDEKNLKLYQLNTELVDKYNKKGAWEALMQREPFTQIKDVQIQALLQEYREKNDALKNEKPELTTEARR